MDSSLLIIRDYILIPSFFFFFKKAPLRNEQTRSLLFLLLLPHFKNIKLNGFQTSVLLVRTEIIAPTNASDGGPQPLWSDLRNEQRGAATGPRPK